MKGDGSLWAHTPSSTSPGHRLCFTLWRTTLTLLLGRKEPGALDGGKKCREQNASPTGSSTSPPYLKLTPLHLHLLIWWYHLLRLWEIPGYKSSTDGLGFSFLGSAKLVTSKVFSGLLNSKILLGFSQVLILWTSLFSYVNELYLLGCFPLNQKPQFKVAFKKRK